MLLCTLLSNCPTFIKLRRSPSRHLNRSNWGKSQETGVSIPDLNIEDLDEDELRALVFDDPQLSLGVT